MMHFWLRKASIMADQNLAIRFQADTNLYDQPDTVHSGCLYCACTKWDGKGVDLAYEMW